MNNQNAEQTYNNLEQFLLNDEGLKRLLNAPVSGRYKGWISYFSFYQGRTYFEQFVVDERAELLYIELSLDVMCLKPYRRMLGDYLEQINSIIKNGKICIQSNGHVYMHIAQYFKDNPIEVDTINEMERNLIVVAEEYGENIQKAANGYPVSDEDDTIKDLIEKMMNQSEEGMDKSEQLNALEEIDKSLEQSTATMEDTLKRIMEEEEGEEGLAS